MRVHPIAAAPSTQPMPVSIALPSLRGVAHRLSAWVTEDESVHLDNDAESPFLTALSPSPGILSPPFMPRRFAYTVLLPFGVRSMVFSSVAVGAVRVTIDHNDASDAVVLLPGMFSRKVVIRVNSRNRTLAPTAYLVDVQASPLPPPPPTPFLLQTFDSRDYSELPSTKGVIAKELATSEHGWLTGSIVHNDGRIGFLPSIFPAALPPTVLPPLRRAEHLVADHSFYPSSDDYCTSSSTGSRGSSNSFESSLSSSRRIGGHGDGLTVEHTAPSTSGGPSARNVAAGNYSKQVVTESESSSWSPLTLQLSFQPRKPVLTCLIMLAQIVMLVGCLASHGIAPLRVNPLLGPTHCGLRAWGGRWGPAVVQEGRLYLLLTSIFLPVGIFRLLLDWFLVWRLCASLERVYGAVVMGTVFLAGGVGGNVLGALLLPAWLSVGPGGAIFGVAGGHIWIHWFKLRQLRKSSAFFLSLLLSVALLFGCFPGVDNWTQIGGLVFGCVAAALCVGQTGLGVSRAQQQLSSMCAAMTLVVLFVSLGLAMLVVAKPESPCVWCETSSCFPSHSWCNTTARLDRERCSTAWAAVAGSSNASVDASYSTTIRLPPPPTLSLELSSPTTLLPPRTEQVATLSFERSTVTDSTALRTVSLSTAALKSISLSTASNHHSDPVTLHVQITASDPVLSTTLVATMSDALGLRSETTNTVEGRSTLSTASALIRDEATSESMTIDSTHRQPDTNERPTEESPRTTSAAHPHPVEFLTTDAVSTV